MDNDKWYREVKPAEAASKLSKVTDDDTFEEREKVYEESRKELMCQFRY